ncbi:hypothetical protein [Streptacidiphilus rugosus]|uniref:hypothetical protein n=1 Tax=Streptacidiphilus rugosus TaxID=405783 RepID=UPI0012F82F2C|nr:hypothetical protein [Streptacidiphilus rugosus]
MVARQDKVIPPDVERFMANRAHSHTIEVKASHAVAVSHPDDVTGLILSAAHTVG